MLQLPLFAFFLKNFILYISFILLRYQIERFRRSGKRFSEPRIHAFVYEPTTGEARKLPVDFKSYLKELRSIYDLYKIDTKPIDIIESERCFDEGNDAEGCKLA